MVVLCARRHGMIANLTRWVRVGPASKEERAAELGILQVEAEYFAATRPGATLGEVLERGSVAYAHQGFSADEWQNHHQGGAAGYAGRDPRAVPAAADRVHDGQVFAWNPSARTASGLSQKVEDTVLLAGGAIRPLTVDPAWPTVSVQGLERPVVLEV